MSELWLIFLTGLLSGFHCLGMCGSLVITYNVSVCAKNDSKKIIIWPHLLYFISKLFSYSLVGAILGLVGSFLIFSGSFKGIISILAGIFMILMSINLLNLVPALRILAIRAPQWLQKMLNRQEQSQSRLAPIILGLLTGLMPCGPLQAMQLYAAATASPAKGALAMLIFGLGTIPLMFGFAGFVSLITQKFRARLLKIGAVVVIILGIIMLNRGLLLSGFRYTPSYIWSQMTNKVQPTEKNFSDFSNDLSNGQIQEIKMVVWGNFNPDTLIVKKDIPVKLIIDRKDKNNFCTSQIVFPSLGITKNLPQGETIIEFIPTQIGEFPFTCGMGMLYGTLKVTE